MVPTDPRITGTIIYTADDLKLLGSQFGQSTPLALWQSTLAAGGRRHHRLRPQRLDAVDVHRLQLAAI